MSLTLLPATRNVFEINPTDNSKWSVGLLKPGFAREPGVTHPAVAIVVGTITESSALRDAGLDNRERQTNRGSHGERGLIPSGSRERVPQNSRGRKS